MKVAVVHDDFVQAGGAESLFATIASIWPNASVFTSLVDWNKLPNSIDQSRVTTSWMQKIPFAAKFYKALLPLYPLAFESFNFDNFDVVISSTTRFAKSIVTKPKTVHVSYINSVPRFLWNEQARKDYLPSLLRIILGPILSWLKRWDQVAASRPDFYIANSLNVSADVKKHYNQQSKVIFPFADLDFFVPAKVHSWKLKSKDYFLVVSRLVAWKKIDLAIKACANLERKLIIVGDGPHKQKLQSFVKELKADVVFAGRVTKEELRSFYQNCHALIVTQQEDFGIAAVEAQACGRPVIAYKGGGVVEIIVNNQTGILFETQSTKALQDAISMLSSLKWSVSQVRRNALKFSGANFAKNLKKLVLEYAGR